MDAALLIARLVLAAVFTLAGVAKLSDLKGSRKAIIEFGLPTVLASPLALLLPLAELAVAAALIPASSAWWGALGAWGCCCCSWLASPSTSPAVASRIATASGSCTQPLQAGRR